MGRIRAGYVRWANPFSKAVYKVSLRPEDVTALVFWSKNYAPFLPHLDKLGGYGIPMLFHFTITGLPRAFEPRVPDAADMVTCAHALSERYGADAVLWRYDPIVISSITDRRYHLQRFEELCIALQGAVKRCYFSFTAFYRKVQKNTKALKRESDIICRDLPVNDRIEMANALADIAAGYGIDMLSCCGAYLVGGKIGKAHCVDAELLRLLFPERIGRLTQLPSRDDCGCCACTDIGAYDTCPHGCVYCYANTMPQIALRNSDAHDPSRDILGGATLEFSGGAPSANSQPALDLQFPPRQ